MKGERHLIKRGEVKEDKQYEMMTYHWENEVNDKVVEKWISHLIIS